MRMRVTYAYCSGYILGYGKSTGRSLKGLVSEMSEADDVATYSMKNSMVADIPRGMGATEAGSFRRVSVLSDRFNTFG